MLNGVGCQGMHRLNQLQQTDLLQKTAGNFDRYNGSVFDMLIDECSSMGVRLVAFRTKEVTGREMNITVFLVKESTIILHAQNQSFK